ncbi:MAG: FtsQ-type POTRA domain-containing protein [Proteobacteria bacterium]|nr:FtsQ-type POTRA domain-containing protein [Pseudomonadota bacterium]
MNVSGLILTLGILSFSLVISYSALMRTKIFSAKRIGVTGQLRLSETEILRQAGLHKGDNIFAVNLNVARQRLMAHPWISKAEVIREMPDGILIRIKEHKALAIVELGKRYLMNTEGDIFKHFSGETEPFPEITGLSPEDIHVAGRHPMKHETNPHKAVMNIIKLAQEPDSRIPLSQIKEILVDREIGLTLLANGPFKHIKLGYGDYDKKINRLIEVSTYLKKKADLVDLDSIDLHQINRIVVKPTAQEASV